MTDQTVRDHVNGRKYGGKVLSTLPAPEGWLVRTEVSATKKGETSISEGETWHPVIAWGHVEAMDRAGSRTDRLEPLFMDGIGTVVHTSEFRWSQSAGEVDADGWRTLVSVDVVPPREMRERLERLNCRFCSKHTDKDRTASDCERCEEERRLAAFVERKAQMVRDSRGDVATLTRAGNSLGCRVREGQLTRDDAYSVLFAAAKKAGYDEAKADRMIREAMNMQIEDKFDVPE
ncbi:MULTISPECIES: hypothetical protein [Streptomyces]|uniref:Uncharacterized protein n=2 Tax=Streptomyces griseus group TaxID=629295 RepID=A0A380P8A3_STRGR|nr:MULTISPECIES: hypothetical protein [Streptomyces]NEE56278.1 hypothetical protein [Streptomyces sp. SID8455]RPK88535.1 hypothetical protein EES47_13990 [Streptomyces sp. ADI98-12]SUP60752.1 Uncharacterised protein [Streptomyces griseus]